MGRRKIEIQPITHERNRSVTFLKRKNGLFKKAYELGVLCSVDVAVIIFEERPGHHVKLYQYGSSDIHDIVQRHLRHDGEKDTRGPQDFSGNNASKMDDIGEGDEDDDGDDDDGPSRSKRRHDGKTKPSPDMATGSLDYNPSGHRSLPISQPPPLSLQGIGPGSGGSGGPSHPISNDRGLGNVRGEPNRRSSRMGLHGPHSRSPSDDINPGSGNYPYYSGQGSGPFNRPNQYGQHHPSQHHGHPSHHSGPQYPPFFPVSTQSHTSPPPSFIPLQSDFSRSSRGSGGGGGGGGGGGPQGFGLPTRSGSSSSYDNPSLYPSMMRGQPSGSSQGSGPGTGSGGGDLFAAFLDADEQSRHQSHGQQGSGLVGLDWPVHNSGGGGSSQSGGSVPSSSVSNPSATPSSANAEGPNSGHWLDFLSGNNPNGSNNPPSGRSESMSWERGGGGNPGGSGGLFGGGGGGGERGRSGSNAGGAASSTGMMGGMGSGRHSRGGDDVGSSVHSPGLLSSSPSLNNGRVVEIKKEILKDGG